MLRTLIGKAAPLLFLAGLSLFSHPNLSQAAGCNATSLDPFTSSPSSVSTPRNVALSWNGTNSCEYVFISTDPLSSNPTWTQVTFPPFQTFIGTTQTIAIRGYDTGTLAAANSAAVNATPPAAERTITVPLNAPLYMPTMNSSTSCVGAPPATQEIFLQWDEGSTGYTWSRIRRYDGSIYGATLFQGGPAGSLTDAPLSYGGTRAYMGEWSNDNNNWGDAVPHTTTAVSCDATLLVRVIDENGSPLSGATWSVSGGALPGAGSGTSLSHSVRPATAGSLFTVSGWPTTVGGRNFMAVRSSDGSGSSVLMTPGQNKWVEIQYGPAPVACTIDLKGNGSDGPISVTAGSNVLLTWQSTGATMTSGSGFSTSGATQNTLGVSVTPGSSMTYVITGSGPGGNCSDSVTVNVLPLPPAPSITLSAAPVCSGTDSQVTLTWAATHFSGQPSYVLRRGGPAGVVIYSGSASSFTDTSLSPGSSYLYHVTATWGAETAQTSTTVTAISCGSVPTVSLQAVASCVGTDPVITLSWSASNSPTNYVLRRNNSAGQQLYSGLATSFTDAGRTTGVTYTYYLEAINSNGAGNRTASATALNCSGASPLVDMTAGTSALGPWSNGPLNLLVGQSLWLSYTRSGFTPGDPVQCSFSYTNPSTAIGAVVTPGSTGPIPSFNPLYPPSGGRTYTLACQNLNKPTEAASDSVTVLPPAPTLPTVSLSANPTTVTSGGTTQLSWSSTNATACTASASPGNAQWSGSRSLSGIQAVTGITQDTTFILTCNGPGGQASASVVVTVGSAPSQITVVSNLPTSWNVSNTVPITGSGLSQIHGASPALTGTMYVLSGVPAVSGYTVSVTNSISAGSALTLFPGQSATFTITYTPVSGPAFDYSMSNSGNIVVTLRPVPTTGQTTITMPLVSGTPQLVTVTPSGIPSGVAWALAPTSCNPTCSVTIALTVSSSVPPGTYPIVMTGTTPGIADKSTSFNLVVNPPAGLSLTCSASPSPARVNQPVTWTAVPAGGMPPYTFVWSGTDFSGNPTSNPYVHMYGTTGIKNARATVTDANGSTATCPSTQLQVIVDPEYQEF